jgi:hypothetical protein
MSWSSHPDGSRAEVTVNSTGLLSIILGAPETTSDPEVAPLGIVMLIDVVLQELIVTGVSFKRTTLLPCEVPKFEPLTTTWLPAETVVADTPVITGAGLAVELTDTLSNVPVNKLLVLPLLIASPI